MELYVGKEIRQGRESEMRSRGFRVFSRLPGVGVCFSNCSVKNFALSAGQQEVICFGWLSNVTNLQFMCRFNSTMALLVKYISVEVVRVLRLAL